MFQSIHQDSKDIFKDLFSKTCFTSIQDMREKIDYFLKNSEKLETLFLKQQNNFESDDLNYKTIKNLTIILKKIGYLTKMSVNLHYDVFVLHRL